MHQHSIWCRYCSRRWKKAPLSASHLQLRLGALVRSDADVAIEEASYYFRFVIKTKEEDEEIGGGGASGNTGNVEAEEGAIEGGLLERVGDALR
ncbi:hypothetical protein HN51_063456 [Arachis hypogaea]